MEEVKKKLREITGKKNIVFTEKGNAAIKLVLDFAKKNGKKKVLIQDQGGWITYKQFPLDFGLEIIELKTNYGIIDIDDLEQKADGEYVLLANSMPGYIALDDSEEIYEICKKKKCLYVNDVSGSIGTDIAKIGDIIIGSFGRWKPINLEYGGFAASNEFDLGESNFDEEKFPDLLKKLDGLNERLKKLKEIRKKVIDDLKDYDIIHKDEEGLTVVVKIDERKERIINYCKQNNLEYIECPRYIRVNEKAISIEVKRQ